MSDSETEHECDAYEPWPGCVMSRTGCHFKGTYFKELRATTPPAKILLSFLHLPLDGVYRIDKLEDAIIARAQDPALGGHGMKSPREFEFDGNLWEALGLARTARLRVHHLAARLDALWEAGRMPQEPEK